jgi:hypothetical protein
MRGTVRASDCNRDSSWRAAERSLLLLLLVLLVLLLGWTSHASSWAAADAVDDGDSLRLLLLLLLLLLLPPLLGHNRWSLTNAAEMCMQLKLGAYRDTAACSCWMLSA